MSLLSKIREINPFSTRNYIQVQDKKTLLGRLVSQYKERYEKRGKLGKAWEFAKDTARMMYSGVQYLMKLQNAGDEVKDAVEKSGLNPAAPESAVEGDGYRTMDQGVVSKKLTEETKNQLLPLLNEYRSQMNPGLSELKFSEELCTSAKKELSDGLKNPGWRKHHQHSEYIQKHPVIGEVITSGYESLDQALKNFMESPLHQWYLMRGFTEMGFATAQGEDGRRYLIVHFKLKDEQEAVKPPQDLVEKTEREEKRPLDEKETAFLGSAAQKLQQYWNGRAEGLGELKPSHAIEEALKQLESPSPRLRFFLSTMEEVRKSQHPEVQITVDKERKAPPGAFGIKVKKGTKEVRYMVNSKDSSLVFNGSSPEPVGVPFDLIFEHFEKTSTS